MVTPAAKLEGSSFPLHVLIADDDQELRRTTRLMLARISGIKVVAIAHDGAEAIGMARKHKPHIAIMDVNMPNMDGLKAIRQLSQEFPAMVCVVMSVERDYQTLQSAMTVGARDYLIKPFTFDQLMITIRRSSKLVLEQQRNFQSSDELRRQRDTYLRALANEYVRNRRTDDEALSVLEELATAPHCEPRWLQALAMIYLLRKRWSNLKEIAARLEKETQVRRKTGSRAG